MAARGTRNKDHGEEKVEDEGLIHSLRVQARRVHRSALIMALVLTLVALGIP